MITGIDHIVIVVRSLEAAMSTYRQRSVSRWSWAAGIPTALTML